MNIKYEDINIKKHSQVTYHGCVLDETMSGKLNGIKSYKYNKRKIKVLLIGQIDFYTQNFKECSAMHLFSHILITHVQPGTIILLNKRKRKYKLFIINAYDFA